MPAKQDRAAYPNSYHFFHKHHDQLQYPDEFPTINLSDCGWPPEVSNCSSPSIAAVS